jgi:hypothetical protein
VNIIFKSLFLVLLLASTVCAEIVADFTSSSVRVRTATFLNQSPGFAPIPMNGTWKTFSPSLSITATGKSFIVTDTCTLTNSGIGPDYRLMIATLVDGGVHGETMATYIPHFTSYYETISAGGSAIEGIDPSTPSTHTFELRVFGINGIVAPLECNMTVSAYQ